MLSRFKDGQELNLETPGGILVALKIYHVNTKELIITGAKPGSFDSMDWKPVIHGVKFRWGRIKKGNVSVCTLRPIGWAK